MTGSSYPDLEARVDELSRDMTASFHQLADYQIGFEHRLVVHLNDIDARFDGIDTRLDTMDARFDGIDIRLNGIDARLDTMDARLNGIDIRLNGIDTRLDAMDARFDGIDARLNNIDTEIATIKTTMETEFASVRGGISSLEVRISSLEGSILGAFQQLAGMIRGKGGEAIE